MKRDVDENQLVPHSLQRAAYRGVRRLLMMQQKWADTMGEHGVSETEGLHRRWGRWLGRIIFRALRSIIKPSQRTGIRLWAFRMVSAGHTESLPNSAFIAKLRNTDRLGLNLIGYLHAENGLGESVRSSLRALESAQIGVAVTDVRFGCAARKEAKIDATMPRGQLYPINLFHLNADQICIAYNIFGRDFFDRCYNIMFCVWEQNEFPEDWIPAFDLVDEIWTPSTFCLDVITRKTHKPVVRIPHSVSPFTAGLLDRRALRLPENGFLFLCMADFASTPERKNPLGSLEAYLRALPNDMRDTFLVLKILRQDTHREAMEAIRTLADRCANIIVIDRHMSRLEVDSLIAACDCLLSLHRAEGFGFSIAESMFMGKPVIATGWSGNMDFMNTGNSLPVQYKLTVLNRGVGPYRKGAAWAEPDLDHASELMRMVVRDPEYAALIGARASDELRTRFSPNRVGEMIADRLNRIKECRL
jgi:glycosyltransferase involved in cell wall biosynthesis